MADLSHELGALRFVVDSPLSSKVAMFNNQVAQHKTSQLLNPFSQTDGRASPKPDITKDDYGKPLAGSLTEMRGQKANMHVLREMLELCQIIDSEGYDVKDEPTMRVITFGELFNIYNYISDKCVGILLRARKHKLLDFEGEMLFQRRDDDVPIFLLRPVAEIRREMNDKIESIKRAGSPAPQSTSVLLDKKAIGLSVPGSRQPSVSRTPSPSASKSGSPVKETKAPAATAAAAAVIAPVSSDPAPIATKVENPKIQISGNPGPEPPKEAAPTPIQQNEQQQQQPQQEIKEATTTEVKVETPQPAVVVAAEVPTAAVTESQPQTTEQPEAPAEKTNDSNNNPAEAELPTVVVEATAVYVRPPATAEVSATPAPEPAVA